MKREEQIKSAAFDASTRNDDYKKYAKDGIARMFFVEGAMFADANQPSPWISVEERLPEPEKEVIILNKRKHIYIDFLTDNGEDGYYWWKSDKAILCKDDGIIHWNEITHWMPIPQLPKEEKK